LNFFCRLFEFFCRYKALEAPKDRNETAMGRNRKRKRNNGTHLPVQTTPAPVQTVPVQTTPAPVQTTPHVPDEVIRAILDKQLNVEDVNRFLRNVSRRLPVFHAFQHWLRMTESIENSKDAYLRECRKKSRSDATETVYKKLFTELEIYSSAEYTSDLRRIFDYLQSHNLLYKKL
jgi:hypothetical protein